MRKLVTSSAIGAIAVAAAALLIAQAGGANPLLDRARPGATISWPANEGQTLNIIGKTFAPAITIDASRASFKAIVIRNSRGVRIKGGSVIGHGSRYGIHIDRSSDVAVEGMTITGAGAGVVIAHSSAISIKDNQLVGLIVDGVVIALSSRVLVQGNSCANFTPRPAIYDANGKRLVDGHHPDCIQAWSRPEAPPVSDVKVVGNRMEGTMQGIFFGNHIRNGIDDGGFDRITIEDNIIRVSYPHGIALTSARGGSVRNNQISTVPGSVLPGERRLPVNAGLRVPNSIGVLVCGNKVAGPKKWAGTEPCPRK